MTNGNSQLLRFVQFYLYYVLNIWFRPLALDLGHLLIILLNQSDKEVKTNLIPKWIICHLIIPAAVCCKQLGSKWNEEQNSSASKKLRTRNTDLVIAPCILSAKVSFTGYMGKYYIDID